MSEENQIQLQVQRIEELIHETEAIVDPNVRAHTLELVQVLMDFHGAALARLMEIVATSDPLARLRENGLTAPDVAVGGNGDRGNPTGRTLDALADDDLVSSLLLIYGLHPRGFRERVEKVLTQLQPELSKHGGEVELLSADDNVIRLQLRGNCQGCGSTADSIKRVVDETVRQGVPDLESLEIAGEIAHPPVVSQLVQLERAPRSKEVTSFAN